MKQVCPNCGEKMKNESLGFKCTKCEGFIDLQSGKFYDHKQTPFMPPKTNFEKITKNEDELARFIVFVVNESKNQRRLVKKILNDKNGKYELEKTIKEWLQKECE